MKPSAGHRSPGFNDTDKLVPRHDEISLQLVDEAQRWANLWLYDAASLHGVENKQGVLALPYKSVEIEVPIAGSTEAVKGYADGVLRFDSRVSLWAEIKTEDAQVGALIRQIKSYRGYLEDNFRRYDYYDPTSDADRDRFLKRMLYACGFWIVLMPEISDATRRMLVHERIATFTI
jgi:hypothetical protein